jgi:hypothetical protein
MFSGRAKPIRITGDPYNECPDKWSYTVLWQVNIFPLAGLKWISGTNYALGLHWFLYNDLGLSKRLIKNSLPWARASSLLKIHNHTQTQPHSAGILWMKDRPFQGTAIWQHTSLTRDRHPCPRRESNPQFQQLKARGHRPQSAQPLGSAQLNNLFDLNLGILYILPLPYFLSVVIFISHVTVRETYKVSCHCMMFNIANYNIKNFKKSKTEGEKK